MYQTLVGAQDDGYQKATMPQQPAKHAARYFHPSGRGERGVGDARRDKDHLLVPPPGSTPQTGPSPQTSTRHVVPLPTGVLNIWLLRR